MWKMGVASMRRVKMLSVLGIALGVSLLGSAAFAAVCGNAIVEGTEQCDLGSGLNGLPSSSCNTKCGFTTPGCLFSGSLTGVVGTPYSVDIKATEGSLRVVNRGPVSGTDLTLGFRTGGTWTHFSHTYAATGTTIVTGTIVNDLSGLIMRTCYRRLTIVPAVCGNGAVEGTEQCDLGSSNGLPSSSCSSSCTLTTPACSIQMTPSFGTSPVFVTLTGQGTGGIMTSIDRGDSAITAGRRTGGTAFGITHTYLSSGTFFVTGTIVNELSGAITRMCGGNMIVLGPVCGNGIVESGEQCDVGANNGSPISGCSSLCSLTVPSCSLSFSAIGSGNIILSGRGTGGSVSPIIWGDGTNNTGAHFTGFTLTHTYLTSGFVFMTGFVTNPLSGAMTNRCNTSGMVY